MRRSHRLDFTLAACGFRIMVSVEAGCESVDSGKDSGARRMKRQLVMWVLLASSAPLAAQAETAFLPEGGGLGHVLTVEGDGVASAISEVRVSGAWSCDRAPESLGRTSLPAIPESRIGGTADSGLRAPDRLAAHGYGANDGKILVVQHDVAVRLFDSKYVSGRPSGVLTLRDQA